MRGLHELIAADNGTLVCWRPNLLLTLRSLSNDDGNENGKKPIGLDWQNNNFARARLQRENA